MKHILEEKAPNFGIGLYWLVQLLFFFFLTALVNNAFHVGYTTHVTDFRINHQMLI